MTSSAALEITVYTIFDTVSGRRLGTGTCLRQRLGEVPLYGSQTLFEGEYPESTRYLRGQVMNVLPDPLPTATIADIKKAAEIRLRRTDWLVTRASEDPGKPVSTEVLAARSRIRERSNELEASIVITPLTLEQLSQDDLWR